MYDISPGRYQGNITKSKQGSNKPIDVQMDGFSAAAIFAKENGTKPEEEEEEEEQELSRAALSIPVLFYTKSTHVQYMGQRCLLSVWKNPELRLLIPWLLTHTDMRKAYFHPSNHSLLLVSSVARSNMADAG